MNSLVQLIKDNDIKGLSEFLSNLENVNAIDQNGETALMVACKLQSVEAVRLLLTLGADTMIKDRLGFTAKKTAYWYGEYPNGTYSEACKEITNLIFSVQMKFGLVEDSSGSTNADIYLR